MLAAADRGTLTHFYIDAEDGRIAGFNFAASPDDAPCEVRFGEDRTDGTLAVPTEFSVASAGTPYRTFRIEAADVKTAGDAGDDE